MDSTSDPVPSSIPAAAVEMDDTLPAADENMNGAAGPPAHELPEMWSTTSNEYPLHRALPKPISSYNWENCYRHADEYDQEMCRVWQEEIDKLLIFAGLFSAAVTAFAVESYQWLQDPRDATADLLMQLVALQSNTTVASAVATPFSPSPSAIRINIFWFISLTLSLGTVLVGIMCLQWLREYQRPVSKGSFKDKLSYRQTRYDGLMAWKVPQIVSALPVLLQGSVIIFFVGVFDLLWDRNHVVAKFVLVPIAIVTIFLLASAILPAVQIISIRYCWEFTISKTLQCPYKSPLSWLVCYITIRVIRIVTSAWEAESPTSSQSTPSNLKWARLMETFSHRSWLTLDQFWNISSWDVPSQSLSLPLKYPHMRYNLPLFRAFQWLGDNFPRHSDITYHLYHCLPDLDEGTSEMVLAETFKLDANPDIPLNQISALSNPCYREIASALYLKSFHFHLPTILEHWIRAMDFDMEVMKHLPIDILHQLHREDQDVFFPQILFRTSAVLQHRAFVGLHGKAMDILFAISQCKLSLQVYGAFKKNTDSVMARINTLPLADPYLLRYMEILTEKMNTYQWARKGQSWGVYLLVLDLASTIWKKIQELRVYHGTPNHPQLQPEDVWLGIFKAYRDARINVT